MSPRVTIGMLAILIALGVYVYYGPEQALAPGAPPPGAPPGVAGAQPTPKPQDPALDLWSTDETQVQSVSVQKGSQQAGVQRDGDGWLVTPSQMPGDRLRINSLIFRLANVRATYKVQNPTGDADYGLNAPSLIATLGLANGNALRLTIGAKAVGETGTYARKDGDPAVYLVSNALVQDLDRIVTEPPVPPSPTPAADVTPSPNP